MTDKNQTCCSCGDDCCGEAPQEKRIVIDYLYLDLSTCGRCQGTEANLEDAIRDVASVLQTAGYEVTVNKIHISSRERAIEYRFVSSPTIRVNGHDIVEEVKESSCKECGDLCGDSVECRVWVDGENEYLEPPKSMIINAILKEVYGDHKAVTPAEEAYEIPLNLEVFFEGLNKTEG